MFHRFDLLSYGYSICYFFLENISSFSFCDLPFPDFCLPLYYFSVFLSGFPSITCPLSSDSPPKDPALIFSHLLLHNLLESSLLPFTASVITVADFLSQGTLWAADQGYEPLTQIFTWEDNIRWANICRILAMCLLNPYNDLMRLGKELG